MLHRLSVGGCVLASALVLTAPAAAKPAPFASSQSHAKAASRRPHAASHATKHAKSSSAATLYVNGSTGTDASNTCRLSSHPCKTIGYALTQAPAGSTINVAAGIYPEQLTITQNVTIKGVLSNQHKPATIIKPTSVTQQDTDPDGGASTYPIVDFAPGVTSGNLTNIEVNGTGAQSSISGCGPDYIGVFYHDASGTLNTDHVTGIEDPSGLGGCQGGLAIYAATDQTTTVSSTQRRTSNPVSDPSHVAITSVTVDNYQKNGITCDDVGTVCTIKTSTVTGQGPTGVIAQNGIQIVDGAGSVANSVVTGNSYTSPYYCPSSGSTCNGGNPGSTYYSASGILVLDAGNVSLTGDIINSNDENVYEGWDPSAFNDTTAPATQGVWTTTATNVSDAVNNTGTAPGSEQVPFGYGIGDGLDLDGANKANVHGATALNEPGYGIGVFATTNSTVFGNRAGQVNNSSHTYQDGEGIYVGDPANDAINQGTNSSGNTIQSNIANGNVLDGIFADTYAQGNTFKSNTLDNNGHYDAEDKSSGAGTAGTANTWTGNHCVPSNDSLPLGLCS